MGRLTDWLKNNGCEEIKIHFNPDGFFYNIETKEIALAIETDPETDEYFIDFLEEKGCDVVNYVPTPVLAFLHELGHYHTIYDYEQMELMFYNFIKEAIGADDHMSEREKAFAYWESPDELDANMWAINFMMDTENTEALNELINIFGEIYSCTT